MATVLVICTAPAVNAAPVVTVTGGAVSGVDDEGITEYLGIPFASAQRFAAPVPAAPWPGVRRADTHGDQCPQLPPTPGLPSGIGLPVNSENCLSIDLYVPANAAGRNLPVMVFLYGGGNVLGSNQQYDAPTQLVWDGDVIVAVPNYRLGPFGFLALPELASQPGGGVGNYGTLDQQAALRWIRDNAAAFGGNPENVTLFGESAGGIDICAHLVAPESRDLFDKAIVQSGPCTWSPGAAATLEKSTALSVTLANEMGCTDPATRVPCLRAQPMDRLLGSAAAGLPTRTATWSPVVDGTVITENAEDALRAGSAAGKPIIMGTNKDEAQLFATLGSFTPSDDVSTPEKFAAAVRGRYPDRADAVLAAYPLSSYASTADAYSALWTDAEFACTTAAAADAAADGGSIVRQYEFGEPLFGPAVPGLSGSFHGAELPYLFTKMMGIPFPWTGASAELAHRLKMQWTSFARNGNPNGPGLPDWPARSGTEQPVLTFDKNRSEIRTDFASANHCDVWG